MRTIPEHIYDAEPKGDFGILESYLRGLKAAQRFIYLENQFLWSPEVEAVLLDKIANPPHPDFRVVLVLPAKPNSGSDDTRGMLACLIEADDDAGRVLACTLYARSEQHTDPSTSTRRSRSSTTSGSRSARRTSTSIRCSTTPR